MVFILNKMCWFIYTKGCGHDVVYVRNEDEGGYEVAQSPIVWYGI
jgi:hypothetical protein